VSKKDLENSSQRSREVKWSQQDMQKQQKVGRRRRRKKLSDTKSTWTGGDLTGRKSITVSVCLEGGSSGQTSGQGKDET